MLGCIQPMSSPMMNRILGFCCWAVATPANSGMAARTATTVHIRSLATTALLFIHGLLSCPAWCRAFDIARLVLCRREGAIPLYFILTNTTSKRCCRHDPSRILLQAVLEMLVPRRDAHTRRAPRPRRDHRRMRWTV